MADRITVNGERYTVFKDGMYIGEITLEDGSYLVLMEEHLSLDDLKELLRVMERIVKENDL